MASAFKLPFSFFCVYYLNFLTLKLYKHTNTSISLQSNNVIFGFSHSYCSIVPLLYEMILHSCQSNSECRFYFMYTNKTKRCLCKQLENVTNSKYVREKQTCHMSCLSSTTLTNKQYNTISGTFIYTT